MPSTVGHREYDENLLASAPVATKAQLQSGYNPDLLVEKPTPPPSRHEHDLEARGRTPVERADDEQPIPPKVPFYRTRKGIIIIFVAVVVIIAVIVGGAVAGSKKPTTEKQQAATDTGAPSNATASGASANGVSPPTTTGGRTFHSTTTSAPSLTTSEPQQGPGSS